MKSLCGVLWHVNVLAVIALQFVLDRTKIAKPTRVALAASGVTGHAFLLTLLCLHFDAELGIWL